MAVAKSNYDIAIKDLVYRPGVSPLELVTWETAKKLGQFFGNVSKDVHRLFKDKRLIQILEFPVLFLGAKPSDTPSFYNFMNHADFGLGTWHPDGGMYSVVKAMESLAIELGVEICTNTAIEKIIVDNGKASGIVIDGNTFHADTILSGADYHHTETLVDAKYRVYSERYWERKTFAPSALLFYVGLNKRLENVAHHTLFFDTDFDAHAKAIYDVPSWPESPLFYASFPSITDKSVAPDGKEAAIFLIPLAPGIKDTELLRNRYFEKIVGRLESLTNQDVKNSIIFKESFCVNDFVSEYNSYKGNAYGLANTLMQWLGLPANLVLEAFPNLVNFSQKSIPLLRA